MIGEVADKEFLGVTHDNTAEGLERILRKELVDKGKTATVVNMDMSSLIRGVTHRVFPDADIMADKFHVIKHINRVIDLCRIAVEKSNKTRFEIKRTLLMSPKTFFSMKKRIADYPERYPKLEYRIKKFESIYKSHPEIRILWDLKNKIHGFYRCGSPQSARKSWNQIQDFLASHTSIHPEFLDLIRTLDNWKIEILNYFVHHTTNAYIEGLNNRIETLKRKKFGFRSKEKFLKCLLYALFPLSDFFLNPIIYHFLG